MKNKPNENVVKILGVDRTIHEPARMVILSFLYVLEEADFLFILSQTGLTQGNLSSHLTKLEDAGLIKSKKSFVGKRPRTSLSMTGPGREKFEEYLETMKAFFTEG
jgi:DNA-binding MarR family transcriptional regulator